MNQTVNSREALCLSLAAVPSESWVVVTVSKTVRGQFTMYTEPPALIPKDEGLIFAGYRDDLDIRHMFFQTTTHTRFGLIPTDAEVDKYENILNSKV